MSKGPDKKIENMTVDELTAELNRLKDNLCDLEDMHSFTFGRTSVHIGATSAQNMQEEYEEECKLHNDQIATIEALLKKKSVG